MYIVNNARQLSTHPSAKMAEIYPLILRRSQSIANLKQEFPRYGFPLSLEGCLHHTHRTASVPRESG